MVSTTTATNNPTISAPTGEPSASSNSAPGTLKLFGHFITGQASVQGLNLVVGFLLLRWMSVTSYAQYSLAFACQTTLNTLVDLGFSGCIVALVGNRVDDPRVIGNYIACARHYRNRIFLAALAPFAMAFPFIVSRFHWSLLTDLSLWGAVVGAVLFQRQMLYGAPLLIQRRLPQYYRATLASAILRALIASGLHVVGQLTGAAAAWFSAISIAVTGTIFKRYSRLSVEEPASVPEFTKREMRNYLAPLWPGLIFASFQAQIGVVVVSMFGHVHAIAEVAALGRVGQIFIIASAANPVLIEPMFARLPFHFILRRYLPLLATAASLSVAVIMFGYLVPEPFMWLLGPHYATDAPTLALALAGACMTLMGSFAWTVNSARKLISWRYTVALILAVISTQIVAALFIDLSRTKGILLWSLITAIVSLGVHVAVLLLKVTSVRHESLA